MLWARLVRGVLCGRGGTWIGPCKVSMLSPGRIGHNCTFFFFPRMEKTGRSGEGGFRLEPTVRGEPGKRFIKEGVFLCS